MKQVVFKEYANASLGRKFTSMFPGLGYAAGYKVCRTDDTGTCRNRLIGLDRFCNESTNTVVSHSQGITWQNIMVPTSIMLLEKEQARLSCMLPPEGLLFPHQEKFSI